MEGIRGFGFRASEVLVSYWPELYFNLTASGSLMTAGLHSSTSKLSHVVVLVPCPLSLQNVLEWGVEGIVEEHVP